MKRPILVGVLGGVVGSMIGMLFASLVLSEEEKGPPVQEEIQVKRLAIVDDNGKVRMWLKSVDAPKASEIPKNLQGLPPSFWSAGSEIRMCDANGVERVALVASTKGSTLVFRGEKGRDERALLTAQNDETVLILRDKEGFRASLGQIPTDPLNITLPVKRTTAAFLGLFDNEGKLLFKAPR